MGNPPYVHGFLPGPTPSPQGPQHTDGGFPHPFPPLHIENPERQANGINPQRQANGIGPDEGNAHNVIQHLLGALGAARDPGLKESLSNALAALHKHVANFQKERQDALQGKFSPRIMEQAMNGQHSNPLQLLGPAGPAHELAAQGQYAQAAQQWEDRHPYAMRTGHIPAYVQQWLQAANPAASTIGPAGNVHGAQ